MPDVIRLPLLEGVVKDPLGVLGDIMHHDLQIKIV